MTGRLAQFTAPTREPPAGWAPSWNLSPGQRLLILRRTEQGSETVEVLWRLTPGWLKDLSRAPFNVQAETLHDKPMYRQALVARRCIVPVDGFYLWKQIGQRKQPWYLRRREGGLALAGLWERYSLDDGSVWDSCAVITAPASGLAARLSDRMPVSLNSAEQAIWLASATAPSALQPLLLNAVPRVQMMYPVTPAVSSPATRGAHCCTPSGPVVQDSASA